MCVQVTVVLLPFELRASGATGSGSHTQRHLQLKSAVEASNTTEKCESLSVTRCKASNIKLSCRNAPAAALRAQTRRAGACTRISARPRAYRPSPPRRGRARRRSTQCGAAAHIESPAQGHRKCFFVVGRVVGTNEQTKHETNKSVRKIQRGEQRNRSLFCNTSKQAEARTPACLPYTSTRAPVSTVKESTSMVIRLSLA